MNVSLRKQTLKDGRESLYLDYYLPKAKQTRKKEALKLYLYPSPKTKIQKDHNKKISLLAESIRAKRLLQIQHEEHDFSHLFKTDKKRTEYFLIPYFKEVIRNKMNQNISCGTWNSTLKHLRSYIGDKSIQIRDIDKEWIEGFKVFLASVKVSSLGDTLSANSRNIYLSKLKSVLKKAFKENLIDQNPFDNVDHIRTEETHREYLTLEELKEIIKTDCSYPILKKAFLFSALTGLRKCDILKMRWREVQYSKEQGWYIRFTQKKTKSTETLPIADQARELLGDIGEPEALVFEGLRFHGRTSLRLQIWMTNAGISKKITFHCARHTYATIQLTLGTGIYTLSKLLGHKVLQTTQIYGKIIDKKKVEAVNRIPDLGI